MPLDVQSMAVGGNCSMIEFRNKGDFKKTRKMLEKAEHMNIYSILRKYGELGVKALAESTPKDTGKTSESWSYSVKMDLHGASIYWSNSNIQNGIPIAVILRYGHGTGTGGYVQGRDYISPAIFPIFDGIAKSAWEEVTK